MKSVKTLGLSAMAVLMAMASIGASSATAESTALCTVDEDPCAAGHTITHVHYISLGHIIILTFTDVECNALFLGDALNSGLASPLIIHGNFTYTSCLNGCTVTEENGPAELEFLRLGHELADVGYKVLVRVACASINCRYDSAGQLAHGLGPLLSTMLRGEIVLEEQLLEKESGLFCPSSAHLDLLLEPLVHTYISK